MKTLLVIQDTLPGLPGGIANYVYRLCHDLAPDLEVLAPHYGDARAFDAAQPFAVHRRRIPVEPPAFMAESRWHWLRMPYVAYVALAQSVLFLLHGLRLGRQRGIRAVLIGHLYLAPVGWLLGRLLGVPYGVILYGGELHRYFGCRPVRRLLLAALDRARFLVTITDFTRQQYLERGVRRSQAFLRVSPGVDSARFKPGAPGGEVRLRYGLEGKRVLLTVARLVDWKGHDLVLAALPEVLRAVPEAHYLVVGSGPYGPALRRLVAELGLEAAVTFAGFVPESELPGYYAAADLFVQPSRAAAGNVAIEGFGITYVEAGACGLPVIGGRTGGTGEAILDGVTGLRVDPSDPAALAAAILGLLQDPAYARRLGEQGRARAVREFAWPVQTARLRAFLAGLEGRTMPVKALLMAQEFPPRVSGGIAAYYYNLCRVLGGPLAMLAPGRRGQDRRFDAAQPFPIYRLRTPVQPGRFMAAGQRDLRRLPVIAFIAMAQYALFAWHGWHRLRAHPGAVLLAGHLYLAPLARCLAGCLRRRYAVCLHGGELNRYWDWLPVRRAMLWGLDGAAFLTVNSQHTAAQVAARGVRQDLPKHIVHPGVDTARFRPFPAPASIRGRLGLDGAGPVLLSVGRLVEWKGQDVVLQALPALREEFPGLRYVIAGDGPHRSALEGLAARLGVAEAVRFAGFLPEADLPGAYAAADLVVLPAREIRPGVPVEGFGITLVEAAACGRPVVAGNLGGTSDAVVDGVTGLLVDPRDPAAVAGAVRRLLAQPGLAAAMGRAGRERAAAQLTWEAQAARLLALLEEVDRVPGRA